MNYYGELPSYCKGLRKCPVDGLEKSKMMVFLTANANTKCTACLLVCLSKSQFAIIAGKVHNISNMKSPPLKTNQPTNKQNSYILPEMSPIQKLPATEHTAANLTLKAGSREWLGGQSLPTLPVLSGRLLCLLAFSPGVMEREPSLRVRRREFKVQLHYLD